MSRTGFFAKVFSCFFIGGKAFGQLKGEQEGKLDETNEVFSILIMVKDSLQ